MAGLFGTLDISARALGVTQRGLGVTAHNISNVNTPGYTRQRQVLESGLPVNDASGEIGSGVSQRTIERIHDSFLQARLIQEHSSKGSLEAEASALGQLESLFNEQFGDGITPQLSRFYNALQDLASAPTPGQPTERTALIGVAQTVTATFNRFDSQMAELQESTDRAIVGLLPGINALLGQIADLNQEIAKRESVAPANDYRDQQERLIRDLAEELEVTTIQDSQGLTTVLFQGGVPLVEGSLSAELIAVANPSHPFDPTFSSVYVSTGNQSFDVTSRISGGELGGLIESRDVHIADARNDLDALAYSFVQTVNDQHQLGRGLDGADSRDFFTLSTPADVFGAAGEIAVASGIVADPGWIAAGGAAGTGLLGDAANALLLAQLRDQLLPSYAPADTFAGGPSGISQSAPKNVIGIPTTTHDATLSLRKRLSVRNTRIAPCNILPSISSRRPLR